MREIKFRAWDETCRWMLTNKDLLELTDKGGSCIQLVLSKQLDCNLMQYTGLKDHNGVEIYEGDIVSCEGDKFKGVVNFYNGCYLVDIYLGDSCVCREMVTKFLAARQRASLDSPCLVVGNIHQNPELLK